MHVRHVSAVGFSSSYLPYIDLGSGSGRSGCLALRVRACMSWILDAGEIFGFHSFVCTKEIKPLVELAFLLFFHPSGVWDIRRAVPFSCPWLLGLALSLPSYCKGVWMWSGKHTI